MIKVILLICSICMEVFAKRQIPIGRIKSLQKILKERWKISKNELWSENRTIAYLYAVWGGKYRKRVRARALLLYVVTKFAKHLYEENSYCIKSSSWVEKRIICL